MDSVKVAFGSRWMTLEAGRRMTEIYKGVESNNAYVND